MQAHHDVQSSNVFAPRLRGPWLQRPSAVRRLSRSAGVGARTVRSLARRTLPFPRPDADLAGTLRQGPAPLPGPDQDLRRDDPRHEVSRPERKAWTRRGNAGVEASRRLGAPALMDSPGTLVRSLRRYRARDVAATGWPVRIRMGEGSDATKGWRGRKVSLQICLRPTVSFEPVKN